MNINPVITLPVAADLSAYSHVGVKLTSTGINLAAPGDRVIGTMIRGNSVAANTGDTVIGRAAAVQLATGNGLHFITVGNNVAIAMGDELEQWPSGRYCKRGTSITGTGADTGDLVTIADHGFVTGDLITFSVLTTGAGLTVQVPYYVIGATANTFQVSLTSGGSAVAITTDYTVMTCRPMKVSGVAGLAVDSAPTSSVGGIINAILFNSKPEQGVAVLTAATTLTSADSGKIFFLALAGGFTVTLPTTSTSAGVRYKFIVKVAPTTAYIVTSAGGSSGDDIIGYPVASTGGDESANGNTLGDIVNFVANTALPSDWVELVCDGIYWYFSGNCKATGAITITG